MTEPCVSAGRDGRRRPQSGSCLLLRRVELVKDFDKVGHVV